MKKLSILFAFLLILSSCSQNTNTEQEDRSAITAVLKAQEKAWSSHNIEEYMQGYWKSDSLKFYGSSGLTYGWEKTLANYKRGYPSKDHTGTLRFVINDMTQIEKGAYYVMGEYHLTRKVGDANGVFLIIFRKINGEWRIVADMSC
ncbi:YybH family protein [Pseudotenacibaculum haliotis]|uniref:YybH family protein n=1 Tax=Pseudotenacibaculum haliotis TaxID=1862138 RepID=A0ABW5LVZ4_9FLAO